MYEYNQETGRLTLDGETLGSGYSGAKDGKNNPAMEKVKGVGPIPKGLYSIGRSYRHPTLGPICMNLEPDPSNEMFGRSLFRIHGDNKTGTASHGCIVLGPNLRQKIDRGMVKKIKVV
jgi:type VI secretion system (T6SS) effector TldE1-like protein